MGLKTDLIQAKVKAAKDNGVEDLDTSPGSYIEREAEYTKEAIVKFLTAADFSITQLKAPVVLEDIKAPERSVDIEKHTLLLDKAPLFKSLKLIGLLVPGAGTVINSYVDALEVSTERAVNQISKAGATLPPLDIAKDGGGLESTGYVYIGEDPDSQDGFDVENEDGQRRFTQVKLFREDIEDLL
jgi:hypothetical protein